MFKNILNFLVESKEIFQNGMGTTELPKSIFSGKQKVKTNEFKKYVNTYFKPQINKLGFKGKDFYYERVNQDYTEIIVFWTYKVGGAIAVDLFVKFKNINYLDKLNDVENKQNEVAEFHKRLSPNNNLNKHKLNIWWWIFKEKEEENIMLLNDIIRVFNKRGIDFFEQFKNHKEHIDKITTENYIENPEFYLNIYPRNNERKILFFLMNYNLNTNQIENAKKFAEKGKEILENENYGKEYLIEFDRLLTKK